MGSTALSTRADEYVDNYLIGWARCPRLPVRNNLQSTREREREGGKLSESTRSRIQPYRRPVPVDHITKFAFEIKKLSWARLRTRSLFNGGRSLWTYSFIDVLISNKIRMRANFMHRRVTAVILDPRDCLHSPNSTRRSIQNRMDILELSTLKLILEHCGTPLAVFTLVSPMIQLRNRLTFAQ